MAVWPASLPQQVFRDGFQEQIVPAVAIRSKMDSGATKRRRRFTTGPRMMNVTVNMDDTQLATFQTFYNTTLDGGTAPFTFPDPRLTSPITVAFAQEPRSVRPEGATTYLVQLLLEIQP